MENFSLSDIASVVRGGHDGGGLFGGMGGILAIVIILILLWNRNGLGGGQGDYSQFATAASQNEILSGQKFDALSQQLSRATDGICSSTFNLNNSIMNEGRALQTQMAQCCCDQLRAIDSVNYNSAMNTAAINANTTAQTQKILDAICGNRMADMQNQINALQLQSALCGVVRYPNSWTYNAGNSPFCGCNSCCGNI